jgi:hypothetical protein
MGAEILPWVFTSGWASGINAYAVVLIMGLAEKIWHVKGSRTRSGAPTSSSAPECCSSSRWWPTRSPTSTRRGTRSTPSCAPPSGPPSAICSATRSADLNAAFMAATGGILPCLAPGQGRHPRRGQHLARAGQQHRRLDRRGRHRGRRDDHGLRQPVAGRLDRRAAARRRLVTVVFLLKRIRRFKARYDAWGERLGTGEPSAAGSLRDAPARRGDTARLPQRPGPGSPDWTYRLTYCAASRPRLSQTCKVAVERFIVMKWMPGAPSSSNSWPTRWRSPRRPPAPPPGRRPRARAARSPHAAPADRTTASSAPAGARWSPA